MEFGREEVRRRLTMLMKFRRLTSRDSSRNKLIKSKVEWIMGFIAANLVHEEVSMVGSGTFSKCGVYWGRDNNFSADKAIVTCPDCYYGPGWRE